MKVLSHHTDTTVNPASLRSPTMQITHEMIRAASESRARDDEGEFKSLGDMLDGNKTHTVIRAALEAALNVVPDACLCPHCGIKRAAREC